MTLTLTPRRATHLPAPVRRRKPESRGFSRILALMLGSGLLIPLSAVATGPLFARALGPDGRGATAAVTVPVFLAQPIAQLGLFEATTFLVATQPAAWRSIARSAYRLALIQGVLASAILIVLAPDLLRHYPTLVTLSRFVAATLPLVYVQVVTRAVAQGRQRYDLVIREKWVWSGGRLAAVVLLFALGWLTIRSAAWVQWGSGVVCGVALLPVVSRRTDSSARRARAWRPKVDYTRALYTYGMRSWAGSLASVLVLRLDQVLLAVLVNSHELGLYAVAASLAEVPAQGLQSLRDGVFSRVASTSDAEMVARISRIVVALAVAAAVAAVVLSPFVVPLLFGRGFSDSVPMADILLLGTPFTALGLLMSAGLQGLGRPGLVSICQILSLVVTVPLLFGFVPSIGGRGAALATAAAYATSGLTSLYFFCRVAHISPRQCVLISASDVRVLRKLVQRKRA